MVCKDISKYIVRKNKGNRELLFASFLNTKNGFEYEKFRIRKYFFYSILKLRFSEKTFENLVKRHLFQIKKHSLGGFGIAPNAYALSRQYNFEIDHRFFNSIIKCDIGLFTKEYPLFPLF